MDICHESGFGSHLSFNDWLKTVIYFWLIFVTDNCFCYIKVYELTPHTGASGEARVEFLHL